MKVFTCWGFEGYEKIDELGPQGGHGGIQETSMVMALRPGLVQMHRLPCDPGYRPIAVGGEDVRIYSSREYGEAVIEITLDGMEKALNDYIAKGYVVSS